ISQITLTGPVDSRLWGDTDRNLERDPALMIVQGQFDLPAIATAAESYSKQEVGLLAVHKQGEQLWYGWKGWTTPLVSAFLDKETLVVARSSRPVVAAICRKQDNKDPDIPKELAALMAKVDGKQTIWMVALVSDELKKHLGTSPQTRELFANLLHISG